MTTTFDYEDQAGLERKLVATLEALGYSVTVKWRTPAQVAERFGLKPSGLSMKLKRFPGSFQRQTGDSGRLLLLVVTQELETYLRK